MFPESFKPITTHLKASNSGPLASPDLTSIFALFHQPPSPSEKVLLLLHGCPQNHTLWSPLVALLGGAGILEKWHVVIPDLPGYGQSRKAPSPDGSHSAHSKRAVAGDFLVMVEKIIGNKIPIVVVGDDRGARVAHAMAKTFPARVRGLCILDICPTKNHWEEMSYEKGRHAYTFKRWHWVFLALPPPIPEKMLESSAEFVIDHLLNAWTGARFRGKYDPTLMASWVEQYRDPAVITGLLEDYRAGASIDLDHDDEDDRAGRDVKCPLLLIYSRFLSGGFDVDALWRKQASGALRSAEVGDEETGHFSPLEAVEEATDELVGWLETL